MSKKEYSVFSENVEKITKVLDEAIPEGSKNHEVIFALCTLLAHIFFDNQNENLTKTTFLRLIKETLKGILDETENI